MPVQASGDVTEMLLAWNRGESGALDRLLPAVQKELHKVARGYMRRERPDHTLQATALVNEAYLRLVDQTRVTWKNRAHFIGVAAQLMRRILVDHARKRGCGRRCSVFRARHYLATTRGIRIGMVGYPARCSRSRCDCTACCSDAVGSSSCRQRALLGSAQ